jgi:two-component system LytT family response regulator
MRILIADDELSARQNLMKLLANHPEVEVCGETADGLTTLEAIENLNPDVVLLDIEMPELDGFEVIRELSGPKVPLIIFVTGYNKYAMKAFEVSAVDFLLKPIDDVRLTKALEKARRTLLMELMFPTQEAMQQIHRITEAYAAVRPSYWKRLSGQRKSKSHILHDYEIQAFLSTDEQVYAVTANQERFVLNHTLKELEAVLNPNRFVRVHKQAIVNLDHVREIDQESSGDGYAKLACGINIDLSRRYALMLKEKLTC